MAEKKEEKKEFDPLYFVQDKEEVNWSILEEGSLLLMLSSILSALLCFLAVLFPGPASSAETSFWAEPQIVYNKENSLSRIDAGLSGSITESIGYYAFGNVLSNGYRQIYGGPNWKPFSFLEVGVGVGLESIQPAFRRNAYFQITGEKASLFGTFEQGGSGPYHKIVLNYQATEQLGVGLEEEAFFGRGPRFTYAINKKATLFVTRCQWECEGDTKSVKLGAAFSF